MAHNQLTHNHKPPLTPPYTTQVIRTGNPVHSNREQENGSTDRTKGNESITD